MRLNKELIAGCGGAAGRFHVALRIPEFIGGIYLE